MSYVNSHNPSFYLDYEIKGSHSMRSHSRVTNVLSSNMALFRLTPSFPLGLNEWFATFSLKAYTVCVCVCVCLLCFSKKDIESVGTTLHFFSLFRNIKTLKHTKGSSFSVHMRPSKYQKHQQHTL